MRTPKSKVISEEIRRSQYLSHRQPFLSRNLQALSNVDNGRDDTQITSQESRANDALDAVGISGWAYRSQEMEKIFEQRRAVFLRVKGLSCASLEAHPSVRHEIFCNLKLHLYGKKMHENYLVHSADEEARISTQQVSNGSHFIHIESAPFDVRTANLGSIVIPLSRGRGWMAVLPEVVALELELNFRSMGDVGSLLNTLQVEMPEEMAGSWITSLVTNSITLKQLNPRCSSVAELDSAVPISLPLSAVGMAKEGSHKLNCTLEIDLSVPRWGQSLLEQHNSIFRPLRSATEPALQFRDPRSCTAVSVTYIHVVQERGSCTTSKKIERKAPICIFCKAKAFSDIRSLYQHLLAFHPAFYFWLDKTNQNSTGMDALIFLAKKMDDSSTEKAWRESWQNDFPRLNVTKYLDQANSEIENQRSWAMRNISLLLSNYRSNIQSKELKPFRALLIRKGVSEDALVEAFAQSWKGGKFLVYLMLFLKLGATWNEVVSSTRRVYFKRRKLGQEYRRAYTYKDVKMAFEKYIDKYIRNKRPIQTLFPPEPPEPGSLRTPGEAATAVEPLQHESGLISTDILPPFASPEDSPLIANTGAPESEIQVADMEVSSSSTRQTSPTPINPIGMSDDDAADAVEAPSYSSDIPPVNRLSTPIPQTVRRQGPTPWNVEDLPCPARKKYVVPKFDSSQVALYRSISKRQLQAGELVSESDDDVPMEWMKPIPITAGRGKLLQACTDQMAFMQKWNQHMLRWQPKGMRQYEKAICSFVREHRTWLFENHLVSELVRKLEEAYEDEDITKDVFESCKLYIDTDNRTNVLSTIVNEASQRKRPRIGEEMQPDPIQSRLSGANDENLSKRSDANTGSTHNVEVTLNTASPLTTANMLKHVCLCGQRVTSVHRVIFCANPLCVRHEFHLACVRLDKRATGWFCQDCHPHRNGLGGSIRDTRSITVAEGT